MRKAAFGTILLVLVICLAGASPAAAAPRYRCLDLNKVQFPGYTVYSTHPRGIAQDGTVALYGDIEPTQSPSPAAPAPLSGVTNSAACLFNYLWGTGFRFQIPGNKPSWAFYLSKKMIQGQGSSSMGPSSVPSSPPYYVTGNWQDTSSPYYFHAFLYDGSGSATNWDLGTLGGSQSYANGVNDSAQVVGYSYTSSGTQHAYLFSGSMQDLFGTGDSTTSEATGINNAGQVVGWYGSSAFLWSSGGGKTDLGQKLNPPYNASSCAYAINTAGQVAGEAFDSLGNSHAFLWSNGSMKDLGTLRSGDYNCRALALNDAGQVVGFSSGSTDTRAFLYSGGVMYDLNSLATHLPAGVLLTAAYGINNKGQIIADGGIGGSSTHGYLLTRFSPAAPLLNLLH